MQPAPHAGLVKRERYRLGTTGSGSAELPLLPSGHANESIDLASELFLTLSDLQPHSSLLIPVMRGVRVLFGVLRKPTNSASRKVFFDDWQQLLKIGWLWHDVKPRFADGAKQIDTVHAGHWVVENRQAVVPLVHES
jgi:hypothetical protein